MNLLANTRHVLKNPLDFFYDIQFNGRAKWRHAVILVVLAVAVKLLKIRLTGYSFEGRDAYQVSFLFESFWLIVPWATWCIANWAVSAILDGEGKFKDIVVASSFALAPYIILTLPLAIVSVGLSQSEGFMYNLLTSAIYAWVILLFLIKAKVLHDFELGKLVWITFLTLVGMFIIWFIGLLVFGLINQVINFAIDLVKEIRFRL